MGQDYDSTMRTRGHVLLVALACVAMAAEARETTGGLRGRLTSGSSPVSAAQITATSRAKLGERRTVSARNGVFLALALPPGRYSDARRHPSPADSGRNSLTAHGAAVPGIAGVLHHRHTALAEFLRTS